MSNRTTFRRPAAVVAVLASLLAPSAAAAQACLGLHATRSVPAMEIISNFHRDGLTGPSSLGATLTMGGLFAGVQTGGDAANGQSALSGNGLGVMGGAGMKFGPLDICAGAQVSRDETAGFSPTSANGVFGGAAIPLPKILGMQFSAFGVMTQESRTNAPVGGTETTEQGLAFRTGLATYPRPWLGLRVYEDRAEEYNRLGFSVGIAFGLRTTDSDRDGVSDSIDRCPNTPTGTPVNEGGCPRDTDNDGVIDTQDRCPNTPALTPVTADGCPRDSDGDGVIDTADKCPNTPANTPVTAEGCPRDSDNDGVIDAKDACPNTPAGTRVNPDGCPPNDQDGDGVIDTQDNCPNTPIGTRVGANGCPPDTDGDGVIDTADKCPNTPRGIAVNAEGCPLDADRDGVPDTLDKCPNTPAGTQVDAEGCPGDRDRDGIADNVDACLDSPAGSAVDTRGCPKMFADASTFTLTGVTFETSKAVIRPSSFAKLDSVAAALVANPEVRVEISGHTDNQGPDAPNQRLSQARAEAVVRYFVEKGVAASRMEAKGYGESRPIATNATAAGRAENRRVEMAKLP